SRRRHTRCYRDWSSDVCSSDLGDEGRLTTAKVLSLLDRVGEDIVACVRQASSSARVENFVHGTTIASNAVIENKTAFTGLMTTKIGRAPGRERGKDDRWPACGQ